MRLLFLILLMSCLCANAIAEVPWPADVLKNTKSGFIFYHKDAYSAVLILDEGCEVPYLKGIVYFSDKKNDWVVQMLPDELEKTLRSAPVSRLVFDEENLQYLITHQGGGVSTFDIKTSVWSHKV